MISVEKALQIVLNSTQDFGVEEIPFFQSNGRILKESIVADRDFPPFNRVSMDGIAIDFQQFQNGQKEFFIEGIQAAGSEQRSLKNPKNCIEVMTGAVLPKNTSAVVRYEDLEINNGIATILIDEVKDFQNIHPQGKDEQKGAILIPKNIQISPAEIGVFATVGKSTVKVAKQPKVMIISTGDELVDVDGIPLAHQIRRSNVFTLVSLLENLKIPSSTNHISDDKEVLKTNIKKYLETFDVLLFSGAVSKGKFDFLPEVLEELGVQKLFHQVAQRPGKPFWFGQTETCSIFAFPGNPVSTFVNCLVYFYSWFYKFVGIKFEEKTAILAEDIYFKPDLTYFLQVKIHYRFGHLIATPINSNGSGDLSSLIKADGFIQLPNDKTEFKKGESYPIIIYK
ncbi:molybdopterin molybdotransferase MoeA [Polaribacter gangjinensis]|uniref:Molybdopterin molybdenumtransferase n=1 Tax=Polaribacter gangjinensis TaxID=574710 RepID=A0A2S7WCN4_9FLAO|nr:molybdopterin molybdotransferase MoeA [Polaribacter gangjinensis]PQJ75347.1 molybdopterin molybdenumtransferase MoeA [Polaribacter gangjinensis]